jgi:hypothetical protein
MKDKERRNRDLAPLMACSEHRRRKEFLNQEGTDKKRKGTVGVGWETRALSHFWGELFSKKKEMVDNVK